MVNASKHVMTGLGVILLSVLLCVTCYAMDYFPDVVEIDSISELYEGVTFDHQMHMSIGECAECHHHTTGTAASSDYCVKCHAGGEESESVACKDCHSADPLSPANLHQSKPGYQYHDDKPSLKAAYHLNCLGCHQEMGAPTGCEDCHAKTEAGEKFYHSGEFAPEESAHSSAHH